LVVTYLSSAIDQTSIPIAPWVGALKAFADGPLGSGTAYFYEPFLNQGSNRGLLSDEMHPISLMRDRFMKADAAGLQICTHAIGDEGIPSSLTCMPR
jgi:predicted amidohydrolase YtcJ